MKNDDAIVWRGPDSLRPLLVPLSAVTTHPKNPKDHDLGAIAASMARFGQQAPIIVQKSTGWTIAGNGRLEAASMVGELETALGFGRGLPWTHIAAVFSELGPGEAEAYALADNRTHDLGGYDDSKLASLLVELGEAGGLVATGYDAEDVAAILASLAGTPPPAFVDPEAGMEPTYRCPSCQHEWSGSPRP